MILGRSLIDGGFSSAISATNTDASTSVGAARLDQSTDINTTSLLPEGVTSVSALTAAQLSGLRYAAQGLAAYKAGSKDVKGEPYVGKINPVGYKFNLPPHRWSMPLRPKAVDQTFVGGGYSEYGNSDFHGVRRGRIWYWAGAGDVSTVDTKNGQDTVARSGDTGTGARKRVQIDHDYGFQFLWNPETISTNVQRNMDITPSNADTLRVVSGVFPGQETVSLSIVLDRTNDFAYAKASGYASPEFYKGGYPKAKYSFNEQIETLLKQGTMADLEYLFKAINGAGTATGEWTTLLDKKTSNVGYLSPTLLGFSLGPDAQNNLSYVGWISNISINHTAFTETMIPLRTTVSFSIECFSGSGISSGA
jgi:hypothetical protein